MSAIDFASLMREERKKSRRRTTTTKEGTGTADARDEENNNTTESSASSGTAMTPTMALSVVTTTKRTTTISRWSFDMSLSPHMYQLKFPNGRIMLTEDDLVCRNDTPPFIYHVPDCLDKMYQIQLCDWLLQEIPNNPVPSCSDPVKSNGTWTQLKYAGRRVALFDARIQQPFPEPLESLAQQISSLVFARTCSNNNNNNNSNATETSATTTTATINHILVNDYTTRAVGIMPHTDGPAYEPCTATLSLLSSTRFQFTKPTITTTESNNNNHNTLQLYLEPASLVVFCDKAYSEWLHSIPPQTDQDDDDDTEKSKTVINLVSPSNHNNHYHHHSGRRISLTFRIAH